MEFSGIPMDAFAFLFELRMQNNKEFFDANRDRYKKNVKEPLALLAMGLEPALKSIDPMLLTAPKSCLSRIYRDTRFSHDKSRYRDHMWLGYKRDGEQNSESFVFYFEITPEHYSYGCGTYGPLPPLMEALRNRAGAERARLTQILERIESDGFELLGDDYKRPKVKDAPAPLSKLLNKRGFYLCKRSEKLRDVMRPELLCEVRDGFLALEPIYRFVRGMPLK